MGAGLAPELGGRGGAGRYPYWGAVRYEIRLTRDGRLSNLALYRAGSDRRSYRLAEKDARKIAKAEGRLECRTIGRLSETTAVQVLAALAAESPA